MSSIQEITSRDVTPRASLFTVADITEPLNLWVDESEIPQLIVRKAGASGLTINEVWVTTDESLSGQGVISTYAYDIEPLACAHSVTLRAMVPTDWRIKISQEASRANVINTLLWLQESQSPAEKHSSFPHTLMLEDALDFSTRHGLFGYLQPIVMLLTTSFTNILSLTIENEMDPESDDSWLRITARMEDRSTIQASYDAYTKQFVRIIPWPERGMIRLNLDLV